MNNLNPIIRLNRIDRLLYFYAKCPPGKRGRPMAVGKAASLEKAAPGTVCAKEVGASNRQGKTRGDRTVFYRIKSGGQAAKEPRDQEATTKPTQDQEKQSVSAEKASKERQDRVQANPSTQAPSQGGESRRSPSSNPTEGAEGALQGVFRKIATTSSDGLTFKQQKLLGSFADGVALLRSKFGGQIEDEMGKFERASQVFINVMQNHPGLLDRMQRAQGASKEDHPVLLSMELYKAIYRPEALERDERAASYKDALMDLAAGKKIAETAPQIASRPKATAVDRAKAKALGQELGLEEKHPNITEYQSELQQKWANRFHYDLQRRLKKHAISFIQENPQSAAYVQEAWGSLQNISKAGSVLGLKVLKGTPLLISLLSADSAERLARQAGINLADAGQDKNFLRIMKSKFKDRPEYLTALSSAQSWPPKFSRSYDMDDLLLMLDGIDARLRFYAKCPVGKRGRPMSVGKAAQMEKLAPGTICAKEVDAGRDRQGKSKGERTVFYRTQAGAKNTQPRSRRQPKSTDENRASKKTSGTEAPQKPSPLEARGKATKSNDWENATGDLKQVLKDLVSVAPAAARVTRTRRSKKDSPYVSIAADGTPTTRQAKIVANLRGKYAKIKVGIEEWKKKHPFAAKYVLPVLKFVLGRVGNFLPFHANEAKVLFHGIDLMGIVYMKEVSYGHHSGIYRMAQNAPVFITRSKPSDRC